MQKAILLVFAVHVLALCYAQNDSTGNRIDSFLLRQKGLLGKLARNLVASNNLPPTTPVRNDLLFNKYRGKFIRKITVKRLDFGVPLSDTTRNFRNTLTRLANEFHHKTREDVIRRNLFFTEGDKFVPYLVADNERHLRDLSYLQDVKIAVSYAGVDSVDILVITKDVLSIGGSFGADNTTKLNLDVSESNFAGSGSALLARGFFDNNRDPKFGGGGEYTARNIGGSFIDWTAGYISYNRNFATGAQDEQMAYTSFIRPLVNPYVKFTYAGNFGWHVTRDAYRSDTLYQRNTQYRYYNYDAWVGWNTGAFKPSLADPARDNRRRTLLGLRYLRQDFSRVPLKYEGQYYYKYADIDAILASITVFKQDFYKAQYVYGFGFNEDIPEGADLTLTAGWTRKAGVTRPYVGIDLERYYFSERESYFNYTLKAEGYLNQKRVEDVNLLFNLDYFSRILRFGRRWTERTFISAGVAHQADTRLNEPLFLQSDFGVPEWHSDTLIAGNTRVTLKMQSVFFTPWNVANFRFAPFIFVNLCRFTPVDEKFPHSDWYNSLGGGVRIRNESLIFKTIELKAYFFPQKNFLRQYWRFEFNSNIRFRYNRQFEKKPDFVNINVT